MINSQILLNRKFIFLLLWVCILSSGCSSLNISPLRMNAPAEGHLIGIKEKKDLKISASGAYLKIPKYNESDLTESQINLSLQGGYGLTKHIGIQSNFLYLRSQEVSITGNLFYGSAAIGVFHEKLKEKVKSRKFIQKGFLFDGYLGMGYGQIYHKMTEGFLRANSSSNFIKVYLQGGFHWHLNNRITFALGLRFNHINYFKIVKFNDLTSIYENDIVNISNNDPYYAVELLPRLNINYKFGSFFMAVTSTLQPNPLSFQSSFPSDIYPTRNTTFLLGTTIDLPKIKRWRNREEKKS